MRKPKWFLSEYREATDGWFGPHNTIEAAIKAAIKAYGWGFDTFYVGSGRKLTKAEVEEMGVDYEWEVDTSMLYEIKVYKR